MEKKPFRSTRILRRIGDSYAVTLSKHLMTRKGYVPGDIVEVLIETEVTNDK